jgi:hypothetical protein
MHTATPNPIPIRATAGRCSHSLYTLSVQNHSCCGLLARQAASARFLLAHRDSPNTCKGHVRSSAH